MNIPFEISARTAQLIGMENFANAEGAIVELVKNAYDADADACVVFVDVCKNKEESSVYIIDNGSGMTADTIIRHWMTIGTDDKLQNYRSSSKKRVKSGAKGIGRFALNRLGRRAEMLTFVAENAVGNIWSVDWNTFMQARILADVKASLEDISRDALHDKLLEYNLDRLPIFADLFAASYHGTILRISQLNDDWADDSLNSLMRNLEMLIPAHMQTAFSIYLYKSHDFQWGGRVIPMEYEDFDYKVFARFDGGNEITVRLERNELNFSMLESKFNRLFERDMMRNYPYRLEDFRNREVTLPILINEKVDPILLQQVGAFDFTFFFLKNSIKDDRDKDGNQKYPYNQIDEASRTHWLERFGGVRIYRDEFRVRPYGENGDDWLGLGRRQAKSPGGPGQKIGGYRIRPNQIAGVVNISRLTNSSFEDKSSREGIQENDAFLLFKNLLLHIISAFENDRNTVMYNLSELYREEHPVEQKTDEIIKKVLSSDDNENQSKEARELKTLARSYQSLESKLSAKDAELSMLRGLASMGISVATFTHELRSVMLRLLPRNQLLETILLRYLPREKFDGVRFGNPYRELETMKKEDEKLNNWLQYSLNSIRRSKRDWVEIDLIRYFNSFVDSWRPSLRQSNIDMELILDGVDNAKFEGIEIDLDSIFNNYVTNSISAFLFSKERNKKILVKVSTDHGFAVVDFVDNGVGLAVEYRNNPDVIFNAFETSTVDNKNNKIGTGMGLFIAKGVVSKYPDAMIALLDVEKGFGIRTIFRLK